MARPIGINTTAITDAAAGIADRDGLANVTLAAVARRLGIRSPSLFAHVTGLAGVHRLLALRAGAELRRRLQGAATGRHGVAALRAIAYAHRHFAREHPGLYDAVQRASATPGDDDELYRSLAGAVAPIIHALAEAGVAPAERVHLTRVIRSALHGFAALEKVGGFGAPEVVDESFDRLVDLLTDASGGG